MASAWAESPEWSYRLIPVWRVPFLAVALVFLVLMYREWKRLGADRFEPPGFDDHEPSKPAPAGLSADSALAEQAAG